MDLEHTFILSFEKIVNHILGPEEAEELFSLTQETLPSEEDWSSWCKKLVYDSGFFKVAQKEEGESLEAYKAHQAIYLDYLYQKFMQGRSSLICRRTAILFYSAIKHYQQEHPEAIINLVYSDWTGDLDDDTTDGTFWGDVNEEGCELCIRTKNGKCLENMPMDAYTIGFLIGKGEGVHCGLWEVLSDEYPLSYYFWHELGHLWHELLGISQKNILFIEGCKHPLMRDLFIPALKNEIAQKLIKRFIQNEILNQSQGKWDKLMRQGGWRAYETFKEYEVDFYNKVETGQLSQEEASRQKDQLLSQKGILDLWEQLLIEEFYFNRIWATYEEIFQICCLAYDPKNNVLIVRECLLELKVLI